MVNLSRSKVAFILIMTVLGVLYALPNILPRPMVEAWQQHVPSWMPGKTVNLGLDLQGGAQLLLQVDVQTALVDRLNATMDAVRSELRKENIGYVGLAVQGNAIVFELRDAMQMDAARKALRNMDPDFAIDVQGDKKIIYGLTDQGLVARKNAALDQSIEIVRRRIDETGTKEPAILRQGTDRILLQLPGVENPQRIKDLLGQTAKMTFHMVDVDAEGAGGSVPPGSKRLPMIEKTEGMPERSIVIKTRATLSGDDLVDAQPMADPQTGEWVVNFTFNAIGAKRFGDATKENVGRPFAIVLDDGVISAPVIREPILGGRGQISGNFTAQSAQDLALLLRAGALPAPLKIIEERSVGPSLGADSIDHGKRASLIGMLAVMVLAITTYSRFGVMASVALVFNMIFIFAILSLFQATLTLPGIAGIVLTIGMAVDANVLIFERMREETQAGRTPLSAIDAGYARAMGAVIDTNLTAVISALALFAFGSGPVRGFAITLIIGVITSLFSAVMLTRLMMLTWYHFRRPKVLEI